MNPTCDVLVIGGGVVGLSCAWRLAQKGVRVGLLERGICGGGSSGSSLGALWPSPAGKKGPLQRLHRESLWSFRAFTEDISDCTGIDIGFQRRGRLELLPEEKQQSKAEQDAAVANVEWPGWLGKPVQEILSPDCLADLEPNLRPLSEPHAVLHCRATAQVSPESLLLALKQACLRQNVRLLEDHPVVSLEIQNGRIGGAHTPSGFFPAPRLLIAAGAWSSLISPFLQKKIPVYPLKGQALLLQLERPLFSRIVKSGSIYLLRRSDTEVVVGSTTEPEAGFDDAPTDEARQLLWEGALRLVPALSQSDRVHAWAGIRPASHIRKPILGPIPDIEGLYVAAGHGKIGIGLGPATGRWMADWVVEGRPNEDLSAFAPPA